MTGRFHTQPRYSLAAFTQYMVKGYQPSAVHYFIAEHLQRVERGEIDRLILQVCPRHGKTTLAGHSFPAWCLGRRPDRQFIAASASADLAKDTGREVRNIIGNPDYKLMFPSVALEEDARAAGQWKTAQGGSWYSIGVGGDILGRGADVVLIDDPFGSMADAMSETIRDAVWRWYNGTIYNRLNSGGAIVIIGHRMHEDDLQGRLIERMKAGGDDVDKWEVVRLPALAEEGDPLGREVGAPLWPERFPVKKLERIRANTFGRDWSALYQQNPVPDAGEFFAADRLAVRRTHITDDVISWVRGWDLASTAKRGGDWTVGVMMGLTRDKRVVIGDVRRMRGRPDEVADLIEATARADTRRVRIAIARDPGQAGAAQEAMYVKLLNGFMLDFSAETGSKEIRARPLAVQVNAGNVSMIEGDWNASFREELRAFPYGRHDDQVDAASRAHMVLTSAKAPMRTSDSTARPFGVIAGGAGQSYWYGPPREGAETGEERLARLQRQAKKLRTISADGDEPLPEKAAYLSTSSFKAGG